MIDSGEGHEQRVAQTTNCGTVAAAEYKTRHDDTSDESMNIDAGCDGIGRLCRTYDVRRLLIYVIKPDWLVP